MSRVFLKREILWLFKLKGFCETELSRIRDCRTSHSLELAPSTVLLKGPHSVRGSSHLFSLGLLSFWGISWNY